MGNTQKSRVFNILKRKGNMRPVCSSPLSTVTYDQMKMTGAFFPEVHSDGYLMFKLSEAAYTIMGLEGFRVPFDLCVEAEALGCVIRPGNEESTPSIRKPAGGFKMPQDLEGTFKKGRFPVVFKAVSELRKKYDNSLPIYGGVVGPLTLAGHLYGLDNILRLMIKEADKALSILLSVAEFSSYYSIRFIEEGANVIFIIDPSASGDMISPRHFEKFVLPAYQILRKRIRNPIILHICGDTNMLLPLIANTGFEAFSFEGPTVKVKRAKEVIGDRVALGGNIPVNLMLLGKPREIRNHVFGALRDGIDIVMTGCGIPIRSPMENVKAMVEAVMEFNKNG
jgi:MtaA/CmuA family methyltransferase